MKEVKHTIYGILCPIEKRIIYVGQTVLPLEARLHSHIISPTGKKMKQWIDYIAKENKLPEISIVALESNVPKCDCLLVERKYIEIHHSNGGVLNGNKTGEKSTWDRTGGAKNRKVKTTLLFSKDVLSILELESKKNGLRVGVFMQNIIEQHAKRLK